MLALDLDSEDYAYEFLLDMPVIGIRTHAKVYATIMVDMGHGSFISLEGLQEEGMGFFTQQTVDASVTQA